MISREPKKSEEAAISKFVQALNLPSAYFWNEGRDHVRIIDGSSYINGLFLDRSRKDYYLSFLSDLEADLPLENSLPKIPKTDFNRVIDQTRNSLTYRTLMVSFLARNEAKLPISARYPTAKDGEMIIPSENQGIRLASNERSYMKVDELGLNLSDVRSYFRTLFASSYSNKVLAEGTYPFFSNSEFILFHELGHYIDHWASSELFAKVSKGLSYLPAAAFLNLDTTNLENKLALPNLPQQANQDTLNDLFYLAEMHFDSTPEIWQILGLKLFEDSKGNKTLYINKMSDFFLSCELGMPIRMDHSGIGISSIQMLIKPGTIVEAKYRLPLEAYGALMDVGVYSFGGYVLRLMYPYGLSSLLKNEYRLNLGWIKRLRMLPPQSPVAKS
ncbi:MAG: hypothetical protein K5780_01155 [Alphaproteobacteria bacterium]|nr:hypothetical protein [Alphaproteobacteria bacterium]